MESFEQEMRRAHAEQRELLEAWLDASGERLDRLARWCVESIEAGGKLLLFGNGGSAAQAQHLAAEWVNRYRHDRRALPAIALTTDASVLTSVANDTDFRFVFSRQIEALACPRDLALGFSTSGVSPNIVEGLRAARRVGARSCALLGRDGGVAADVCDLPVVLPGAETARIQELQLLVGHVLCRRVERLLGLTGESSRAPASATHPARSAQP